MNYINNHKKSNYCKPDIEASVCKPKYTEAKKIILECGEGTNSGTFTSSDDSPIQLARVTVDAVSLNKSQALIKFSSLVKVDLVDGAVVRLKYELFKSCDGRQPLSLGIWMYEKAATTPIILEGIEESFDFIFCECQRFKDCCDYFVIVSPIEITGESVTATVSNGRMAALTQDLCNDLNKEQKTDREKSEELESQKIILACGEGSSVGQNIIQELSVTRPPLNLAQVTIDTTCLNKPRILVEFSGTIEIFNEAFVDIVLQFELFRACGDIEPVSCGIWTFEQVTTSAFPIEFINFQYPFSFTFCECQNISKCCVYFVTVTALQVLTPGEPVLSSWVICNNKITAYAQSSRDSTYHHNNYINHEDKGSSVTNRTVHPKPQNIILECGNSNGSRSLNMTSEETSFQMAQVTIDTSSLCKPMVNIEFSSTVSFNIELATEPLVGELQYELFRSCEDGTPISIGVWTLDRFPIINNISTETFSFTYCDCTTCPGCCDYFVTVTRSFLNDDEDIIKPNITVGNGMIAALAQEA